MSFHSWLRNLRSALAPRRGQAKTESWGSSRASPHRLALEALEDRSVPTFIPTFSYELFYGPALDLVAADFNNDSVPDIAFSGYGSPGNVLLGNGDGTFRSAPVTAFGGPELALGDFNDDGNVDLATTELAILLGHGDGTFSHSYFGLIPMSIAVGDMNADGRLDLVAPVASYYDDNNVEFYLAVLNGNGDGTFDYSHYSGPYPNLGGRVALGDFDGDGSTDVVTGGFESSQVFLNGPGGLRPPIDLAGGIDSVAVADLDGDGALDLATTDPRYNSVNVLRGNGDGTFQAAQAYGAWDPHSVAPADVDGDGVLDIVLGSSRIGGVSVLLGVGDGTFAPPITVDGPTRSVAVADFNGDGRLDAAAADADSLNVLVLLNDGIWDGSPPPPPPPPPPLPALSIGDVAVTEGHSGSALATFTVHLSEPSAETVTVYFATADDTAIAGSDYHWTTGLLTFAPGNTSQTITVLVNGDTLVESDEVFAVNLLNAVGATILDGQGAGTIVNDDVPPPPPPPPPPAPTISIGDVTLAEGRKGQTTLYTFTVTLSAAFTEPVTISYRTVNGTATTGNKDYVAKSGTITFAPGETEKTITIEVKGDNKREADEVFYLDLYDASGTSLFAKSRGVGTILNDD